MSDDFDPDEWVESNTGFTYEHIETGRQIHSEAYEGRKHRSNIIESADVTQNDELRALIEEWRGKEGTPGGLDYQERIGLEIAADELEQVIADE